MKTLLLLILTASLWCADNPSVFHLQGAAYRAAYPTALTAQWSPADTPDWFLRTVKAHPEADRWSSLAVTEDEDQDLRWRLSSDAVKAIMAATVTPPVMPERGRDAEAEWLAQWTGYLENLQANPTGASPTQRWWTMVGLAHFYANGGAWSAPALPNKRLAKQVIDDLTWCIAEGDPMWALAFAAVGLPQARARVASMEPTTELVLWIRFGRWQEPQVQKIQEWYANHPDLVPGLSDVFRLKKVTGIPGFTISVASYLGLDLALLTVIPELGEQPRAIIKERLLARAQTVANALDGYPTSQEHGKEILTFIQPYLPGYAAWPPEADAVLAQVDARAEGAAIIEKIRSVIGGRPHWQVSVEALQASYTSSP